MERRIKSIVALAIAMVFLAMSFTGCIGNQNGGSSGSSVTQAKVVVDYNGTWSGEIGTLGGLKSINGTGHQSITVDRGNSTIFVVSAVVHKGDASNANLTVSIESMNGTVIKSDSTTTPLGVVTVTATVS